MKIFSISEKGKKQIENLKKETISFIEKGYSFEESLNLISTCSYNITKILDLMINKKMNINEAEQFINDEKNNTIKEKYAAQFKEAKITNRNIQLYYIKIANRVAECDVSYRVFYAKPNGDIEIIMRDMY